VDGVACDGVGGDTTGGDGREVCTVGEAVFALDGVHGADRADRGDDGIDGVDGGARGELLTPIPANRSCCGLLSCVWRRAFSCSCAKMGRTMGAWCRCGFQTLGGPLRSLALFGKVTRGFGGKSG